MVMRQRLLNICNVLSFWQVQKLQLGTDFPLVLHYHCLVTSADPVLALFLTTSSPTPPPALLFCCFPLWGLLPLELQSQIPGLEAPGDPQGDTVLG